MNSKTTGGPAFPYPEHVDGQDVTWRPGRVTLRDWFASVALAGQLASTNCPDFLKSKLAHAEKKGITLHELEAYAAYKTADAMLKARAK